MAISSQIQSYILEFVATALSLVNVGIRLFVILYILENAIFFTKSNNGNIHFFSF